MKKIIEVLRLKHEANLSHEKISRSCQLSKGVVSKYLSLAQAKGLGWPLPEDTDEARWRRCCSRQRQARLKRSQDYCPIPGTVLNP